MDAHEIYHYTNGNLGMTPSGSFTRDKARWMTFSQNEKDLITAAGKRPYGATKDGAFTYAGTA
jgi:hypothetical protein